MELAEYKKLKAEYDRVSRKYNALGAQERRKFADMLWEEGAEQREKDRKEAQAKLNKDKEHKRKRGETFRQVLEPGMFIKVEGTNDGVGIREVMELGERQVTCRKIAKRYKITDHRKSWFVRDKYITTHGYNKIVKILPDLEISEK